MPVSIISGIHNAFGNFLTVDTAVLVPDAIIQYYMGSTGPV